MLVLDGPVLPDDLTTFVRQVPLPPEVGDGLSSLLPDKLIRSNRVDYGSITRTGRVARFRMYDGPLHVAQRDAATTSSVKLPPLSDSLGVGELERLQIEFARTGGTNTEAFVDAIYDDATILTQNVQRRMALARGDVLVDGKFTMLTSEGTLEADFDLPAGNVVTPAGALWSDHVNSTPLDDLIAWITAYSTTLGNGYRPATMTPTLQIMTDMMQNQSLRNYYSTLVGAPSRLSPSQVNSILTEYGLPVLGDPYDAQVDVDGTSTRITPTNKLLLGPPDPANNLGGTYWGLSATALELVNSAKVDLSFEDAPGIVGVVDKSSSPPFHENTYVDAVGMPILTNPRALMVATVR